MTIPKKRGDTQIGNISGMPKWVLDKYRIDATLEYVLFEERCKSLHELKEKPRPK